MNGEYSSSLEKKIHMGWEEVAENSIGKEYWESPSRITNLDNPKAVVYI